jgi:hypothetical protein
MARSLRYALLILPLLMTTACRLVDQQKDLLARVAAFCVLRPVLEMQSNKATLTQGSVRKADAVAPKQALKMKAPSLAAAKPVVVRAKSAPSAIASRGPSAPIFVIPMDEIEAAKAVRAQFDAEVLHEALAQAAKEVARAECALKEQRERERLVARKRVIVVAPATFQLPVSAATIGG